MGFAIGIGLMFGGIGTCLYYLIKILRYYHIYGRIINEYVFFLFTVAILSFIIFIVGILVTYISYRNSKKRDQEKIIENSYKNVCPKCGLNLTNECQVCPKCGFEIKGR